MNNTDVITTNIVSSSSDGVYSNIPINFPINSM